MSEINELQLYVGNLPYTMTKDEVSELFSSYETSDVKLITDRETGRSRGFAFVTFVNKNDAASALKDMEGKEIDGRELTVKFSEVRPQGEKRSFGGDRPKKSWDNNDRGNNDNKRSRY